MAITSHNCQSTADDRDTCRNTGVAAARSMYKYYTLEASRDTRVSAGMIQMQGASLRPADCLSRLRDLKLCRALTSATGRSTTKAVAGSKDPMQSISLLPGCEVGLEDGFVDGLPSLLPLPFSCIPRGLPSLLPLPISCMEDRCLPSLLLLPISLIDARCPPAVAQHHHSLSMWSGGHRHMHRMCA